MKCLSQSASLAVSPNWRAKKDVLTPASLAGTQERLLKSTKDVVPVVNEDITTLSIELGRCYQFHQSPDKEAGSVIIQPSRLFQDLKLPSRAVPLEASPLLRPTDYQVRFLTSTVMSNV